MLIFPTTKNNIKDPVFQHNCSPYKKFSNVDESHDHPEDPNANKNKLFDPRQYNDSSVSEKT